MLRQYIGLYVFRIIKQCLGMLCKWDIGGDFRPTLITWFGFTTPQGRVDCDVQ